MPPRIQTCHIQTCLWLDSAALEAAQFYCTLFPAAAITHIQPHLDTPDTVLAVELDLLGQRYQFLNGGPYYRLTPAVSISVECESQAEVDRLWDALLIGGAPLQCGWLTDRFGVSWQVIPAVLLRLLRSPDAALRQRVMAAMMQMVKLDGPALEAAAR